MQRIRDRDYKPPPKKAQHSLACARCGKPSTIMVLTKPYVYLCPACLDGDLAEAVGDRDSSKKVMRKEQISDFVRELTEIGCEIMACGHRGYVFGDADMDCADAKAKAHEIAKAYGERDHLKSDIVEYLRSIGRYIDDIH